MSTASAPTARPAAKARTPTSGPGSSADRGQRGFTLIELLIVVALIAVASGVAALALRDPAATRLDQEAVRLAALLEGARAEARAAGLPVSWHVTPAAEDDPGGFRFAGLPGEPQPPKRWLHAGVTAEVVGARAVLLGPEPVIGAQRIVLRLEQRQLALSTDGLSPFSVVDEALAPRP
jgi:general secretion pathway protein H